MTDCERAVLFLLAVVFVLLWRHKALQSDKVKLFEAINAMSLTAI